LAIILAISSHVIASTTATGSGRLYRTLGLSKDCSQDDIRKAYRRLALRHHPDKVPPEKRDDAEKKFKAIGSAYETLSDEKKRKLYDDYGEQSLEPNFNPSFFAGGTGGRQQGSSGGQTFTFSSSGDNAFSFGDFGSMFGTGRRSSSPFGYTTLGDLGSIFEEMMNAGMSGSSFPRGGSGVRPKASQKPVTRSFYCSLEDLFKGCTKKLKVTNAYQNPMSGVTEFVDEIYIIHVKPGWKSGTKVHFPKKNVRGASFPPITFILKEKPHPFLQRVGDDLLWKCKITRKQAEIGAKLKVPLPNGEIVSISTVDRIPTWQGEKMVILDKGMTIKGGERRGNLIIEFVISD